MERDVYQEMPEGREVRITPDLAIPRSEIRFRTSRSGGPGGQHVNKVETRVELLFDIAGSSALSEDQRTRLRTALASWLDREGVLHLIADRHRSQYRNREEAVDRFASLLWQALQPVTPRKRTRTPRSVKEARLEAKRHRSAIKQSRAQGRRGEMD